MLFEKKYSDLIAELLLEKGYTTVFFVAGGNIMHLIESFSHRMTMIPVMHEVNAVIATDYFNASKSSSSGKALALVTVGPGVTNTVTGIAGAYIDGREVLLIGGQVKSSDLKKPHQRQNGIQEVDGISILDSVTKRALLINTPIKAMELAEIIDLSALQRKGPVYLEICLDVQGCNYSDSAELNLRPPSILESQGLSKSNFDYVCERILQSKRPLFLVGGGVSRETANQCLFLFEKLGIPVATTWGGVDRFPANHRLYAGRPNTFGQRFANIFLQQSDLLVVFGSSLGLQQTGFNTSEFLPLGEVIHLDIDDSVFDVSLIKNKYNIKIDLNLHLYEFLMRLVSSISLKSAWVDWVNFKNLLQAILPIVEKCTCMNSEFINPFQFFYDISKILSDKHAIVCCSSGGTYTSFMQTFQNQPNQVIISSRGLGSMGIGPGGSIGTQLATGKNTILFDGDGGFIQNSQELGVISAGCLPIKIFVFSNNGYASIRTTQKKYFSGNYVGCDSATGLGLPNLELYSQSFGIGYLRLDKSYDMQELESIINDNQPWLVEIIVSPDQEYLPKINSTVTKSGSMESNALHDMWPPVPEDLMGIVFKYLKLD